MDVSNKTLALLLVCAIVVSFAGFIVTLNDSVLTGRVTGTANLSIPSIAGISFQTSNLNFGAGAVNTSGFINCSLAVNGTALANIVKYPTAACINFSGTAKSLVIENDGNRFVNVTLSFDKTAATLLGGTNPELKYTVYNNESGSCAAATPTAWTSVAAAATDYLVCTNLSYGYLADTLGIGINITIPENSGVGARVLTITATGTEIAQ